MQLLTGPAGSGKTFTVLEALRAALRRQDNGVRLLAPTATMAQHFRNGMAREGFVFRPNVIQTLHRFIEPWAVDLPLISGPAFHLLVEQAVRRLNLAEFAKVAHLAGFHAKLAAVIEECSAAGVDARALRRFLPETTLGEALVAVFAEVEYMLAERKLGLRATRLALAASRIAQAGTGAIKTVWMDGFFSLTDPELMLVKAVGNHADVTLTLPSSDITASARERLLAMGFQEQALRRKVTPPTRMLFVAPTFEREADEIARRILEEHESGRLFREIGIIVRNPDAYSPVLRATLERFGIPARFYFESVLMEQPAVRYLAVAVDAMLAGWDHAQTLVTMRLSPGAGISAVMDRFDFEVRKRLPGTGLGPLRQLAEEVKSDDQRVRHLVERLWELDGWRTLAMKPADWREQFARLRAIYRISRPGDGVPPETVLAWRSQAAALGAFDAAVDESSQCLDPAQKISLEQFWTVVKAVLRLTPLRAPDQRRDVVHVLSVYEARQWELPVVFVCGMVEGQFPRYHSPDPFLPEHARRRLKENGFRLRTAEDTEAEERFLFESAISRATASLVLSYPRNDGRGEQNLRSLFLDPTENPAVSRPVRLQTPPAASSPVNAVRSADLLRVLQTKHAVVRPTALESYLQCPFQFFGRSTLKLEAAPVRPDERLDFMTRGTIVHCVIAEWLTTHRPVEEIFERVFRRKAETESIPAGYQTEMWRAQMLADLRHFTENDRWPADYLSHSETACQFALDSGLGIRGRIDRLLQTDDGRGFVIDYKYSPNLKDKLTSENLLQGPLYWLAIERAFYLRPAGMYYCSLRDGVEYAGWGEPLDWVKNAKTNVEPFAQEWLDAAIARSVAAAAEIASGRTDPAPADVSLCRRCEYRDVCRYEAAAAPALAEGA